MSRAFRVGIFVVATLLIFSGAIFWIGSQQFLFASTYRLNAEFENAAGLPNGADVRVGGIHQGTVRRIDLPPQPDGKVRVVMDLKNGTREVIKKDSVAAIRSEGLVGDKYVEVRFGSNDARKVENGDTIQSEPPIEIADLIKKTNGILDSAKGAMESVNDTTVELKQISAKINQGTGTVGALVNDKSLFKNINAGANALQENMQALKHNFLLRGFFRNRGYEDSTELAKHEISKLPSKPPARRFAYDASKLFDKPDTAKLKKEKMLNEAGKFLEENPFGMAVIAASTDMRGDSEKERVLTQARAAVVRDYVVQHFKVEDTRIKTIGLGKSAEVQEGGKVDVIVYPPGTEVMLARKR